MKQANKQLSAALLNPVLSGALDLYADHAKLDIDAEIAALSGQAAETRALRLRAYVGELSAQANEDQLARLFTELAHDAQQRHKSAAQAFAYFAEQWQHARLGLVFTAHPTFGANYATMRCIAELAANESVAGQPLGAAERQQRLSSLQSNDHRPPALITLENENDQAESAIKATRFALRRVFRQLYRVASEQFPEHWQALDARLVDVATWVGGDMDGRNDIRWNQSLSLRWRAAAHQFAWLAQELHKLASWPKAESLALDISTLALRLEQLASKRQQQADALSAITTEDTDAVSALARDLSASELGADEQQSSDAQPDAVNDLSFWISSLQALRARCADRQLNIELAALIAELRATGMASAYLHVRLNATQIHNALRHSLGLEGEPTDPAFKRSSLRKVTEVLAGVEGVNINFGNLLREQSSARRMFMQVAQLSKHCDTSSPIRFLIAESDSPFTVLAALYLAKRYRVAERVDISPLFETASALEQGAEIISTLLANPDYRAYVERRGCLCVQTGFSDAGRHLGQVACALAIERFQMKVARALAQAQLSSVRLVLFNTHGESLGRGAHPDSLQQRWLYLFSPEARKEFREAGIAVKHESSFQGADGYAYFHTPALALASLSRALEDCLQTPPPPADAFYQSQDQSLEYFISLQDYHQRLMANPDFARLLNHFAPNLLYATGSRQMRRQHERVDASGAAKIQIRAIVQNAILQQLGWVATACFGVGAAIGRDSEWFAACWGQSERLRTVSAMAISAFSASDTDILYAYIELYNPGFWLQLSRSLPAAQQRSARRVAHLLGANNFYHEASRVAHRFTHDAMRLRHYLERLPQAQPARAADQTQRDRLHQLRIALIIKLFLRATHLPAFSSNPQVSVEDVMRACLRLDVNAAVGILQNAFPASAGFADIDFGESSDAAVEDYDYRKERQQLFEPLEQISEQIKNITAALCHYYGAFG